MNLEEYFKPFRENTIGIADNFVSPFGKKQILYTDWTASGRLYRPIEEKLINELGAYVANTHTETNFTGSIMTMAYHKAKKGIKQMVNANAKDILISEGSGMTGVMIKLQRILGFKINERYQNQIEIKEEDRPVVFISHMEHHSNQTSWYETIADVEIINPIDEGTIDIEHLKTLLKKYEHRKVKIASITAASNVTGIKTNYHQIAKIMHQHNGLCFVDFACSAPYVKVDMHPSDPEEKLDAIVFSPHKFLGGPGTTGILIFCSSLYSSSIPDNPGGGTVSYTNPWGEHSYITDAETREDGGTPAFLQTIKVFLAMQLKEKMGVENILAREKEINQKIFTAFSSIKNLHLLAPNHTDRLGIFSFYIENAHFNLVVKLLNDHFGVQTRGGCSCAGTYGHYLLNVDKNVSYSIKEQIDKGNYMEKPGWVRLSIHPIMTNTEVEKAIEAVKYVAENIEELAKDYEYIKSSNDFKLKTLPDHFAEDRIAEIFRW